MKTFLSAALISMVTASAAQAAAIQFETRAFHSNLRLDAKETTHSINGTEVGTERVHETFDNTAGGGVAVVFNLDEHLDLGLGYSRARYFPGADVRTDQTMLSAFSRWTLYQSPATRFYFLAGLTQHDLDTLDTGGRSMTVESSITPVMNYDVGLGNVWT
ncbi:MAG: hypothetical protein M3Q07_19865, partial [Pseudobdellovibrionaceae bacterium]|nr:hypothetical protein [Pseudobdellovibrionaceae bacterium]